MNRLFELSKLPAEELAQRASALQENAQHWLEIDYESVSAALDIEINTEMSPLVIRRVVEGRLKEMTKAELDEVPTFVWEYLDALDVTGLGNFLQFHPNNKTATASLPFKVRKMSAETIMLSPNKIEMQTLLKELGSQPRWELWCSTHSPEIVLDIANGGVRVSSKELAPWSERDIEEIILSFYDE